MHDDPTVKRASPPTADLTFLCRDHPQANGRQAQPGDVEWVFTFPLADGRFIALRMGRQGRASLLAMLRQEMLDDEFDRPSSTQEPAP